jgi:hypothetical protein
MLVLKDVKIAQSRRYCPLPLMNGSRRAGFYGSGDQLNEERGGAPTRDDLPDSSRGFSR